MKTKTSITPSLALNMSIRPRRLVTALLITLAPFALHAQSGGSLTPPVGAPDQTMKSLDQIEPRTPLVDGATGVSVGATGTFTISESGSYYLTENHTVKSGDGITISASGVTLDLRGFTITSTSDPPDSDAIDVNASHVSIYNGHIISGTTYNSGTGSFSGGGFQYGIYAASDTYTNIHIRDVSVQGCSAYGIRCASFESTIVESCSVTTCGSGGITAGTVSHSTSGECGGTGIFGGVVSHCYSNMVTGTAIIGTTVTDCSGSTNGIGNGISASNVSNSYGYVGINGTTGIDAIYTVNNSVGVTYGSGDGIEGNTVSNSYGTASTNGTTGIDANYSVNNCYGFTSGTGDGIEANIVTNSYGSAGATANCGIDANTSVINSYGSTNGSGDGIQAFNVSNSFGSATGEESSSSGIDATFNVTNCYGSTNGTGSGIEADIISYSRGSKAGAGAGFGLNCTIAIGCTSGGGQSITNKYLMP